MEDKKSVFNFLKNILYAHKCKLCGEVINIFEYEDLRLKKYVCDACESILRLTEDYVCCGVCGTPLRPRKGDNGDGVCALCDVCEKYAPFNYDRAVSAVVHDDLTNNPVLKLKSGDASPLDYMTDLMAGVYKKRYSRLGIEIATSVPTSGNLEDNHSAALCRALSGKVGLEYVPGIIVTREARNKQKYLSSPERRTNLDGSMAVVDSSAIRNGNILVVDDVFTTGATIDECARALKAGGAAKVYGITFTTNGRYIDGLDANFSGRREIYGY